jgi:uncharacterized membrane protein YqjE
MIHPLLRLIATRPELVADHAQAYAELVGNEVSRSTDQWKQRTIYGALALCLLGVGTVLAGVAVMLWATMPLDQLHAPWALVAAPSLPLLVALWSIVQARRPSTTGGFGQVKEQLAADLAMLREVSNA